MMIYQGVVKGKTIELDESLPYPTGQVVRVSVEPLDEEAQRGAPANIRHVMQEPPHLTDEDMDDLERAIAAGKLPVNPTGPFDEMHPQ